MLLTQGPAGSVTIAPEKRADDPWARAHRFDLIGRLAAGIAHEINTPIQYVGDNVSFLRQAFEGLRVAMTTCQKLLAAASGGSVLPEWVAEAEAVLAQADIAYLCDRGTPNSPRALARHCSVSPSPGSTCW